MTNTKRTVAGLFLAAAAASLIACGSTPRTEKQLAQMRGDLTPELVTLSETQADLDNDWAMHRNLMQRMRRDDLRRALLLDRPSRLTPLPTSH